MKKGKIEFEYIGKDEYVITPEGVGIVMEDENPVEDIGDLLYGQIKVKLKDDGKITSVDRSTIVKITEAKYNILS